MGAEFELKLAEEQIVVLRTSIAQLEAENERLRELVDWIDNNRHADWPFASFNLEEWEKHKDAILEGKE